MKKQKVIIRADKAGAAYTVDEFIELCRDEYGGEVIRELEKRLKGKWQVNQK